MQLRIPPHDIDAERALLGAVMIKTNGLIDVADVVFPDMFYVEKHRIIYSAMIQLQKKHEPVDIVSLSTELRLTNSLDSIGGVPYLSDILGGVPMSTNAEFYAKTIVDKYKLRNLARAGEEIVELGFTDTSDTNKTIEEATSKLLNMGIDTSREDTDIGAIMSEFDNTQEEFKKKQFSEGKLIGIPCGISKIDTAIDGLRPGHFWSIAGYTSSGKTQLLLNIINSLITNHAVTFFSLEMSKADIISRLLGIQTGVGMTKIMRHEFDSERDVKLFTDARERLVNSKLKIYSKTNTLDGIILAMTRDILRNKTKVFAIDYIQLVRSKGKSEYEQITEASQRLQTFARETGCSIIVLSQVSNEHAKDQNQEVHGTKGGGSLPASVDLAIELFNEDKKEERDEKASNGEALSVKAIIKKNRHGRCGYVKLDFTPWNGQFKESTDWEI